MAKSLRSKFKRKMRAIKRVRYGIKVGVVPVSSFDMATGSYALLIQSQYFIVFYRISYQQPALSTSLNLRLDSALSSLIRSGRFWRR